MCVGVGDGTEEFQELRRADRIHQPREKLHETNSLLAARLFASRHVLFAAGMAFPRKFKQLLSVVAEPPTVCQVIHLWQIGRETITIAPGENSRIQRPCHAAPRLHRETVAQFARPGARAGLLVHCAIGIRIRDLYATKDTVLEGLSMVYDWR
jgi:hypothetical protein